MNRCKTCKWWIVGQEYGHPTRECSHTKIGEGVKGDDCLRYPYREGGRFYPGPDFGCVHHEASAATTPPGQ